MNVTIIIPTYNESENIEKLIKSVFAVTKPIKAHNISVLVVDDNSPDGTQTIVEGLKKKYIHLHMITGRKQGLGKAYLRGMKYAADKLGAEVLFEMDADFSHDPAEIPAFLKKIDDGYDMVIGSRYIKGGSIPQNWGMHRKIFSVAGNMLVRVMLFNLAHRDWTTGYRAIRTWVYKAVRNQMEDFRGYTFQVSFLHKAFQANAKVAETPIQFVDRVYGKSKIGSEYIINLLRYLVETNLKNPPQFIRFLVVGTLGFIINTVVFELLRLRINPAFAGAIGAELSIISNFIFNNFWTFSDVPLTKAQVPVKFLLFNLGALGSVVIQMVCITLFVSLMGRGDLPERSGYITGVLLGLFWNYLVYKHVIWKKPAKA